MAASSKGRSGMYLDPSDATGEASVSLSLLKSIIENDGTGCAEETQMLVITKGILNGVEIKIFDERRVILFLVNIALRENSLSDADGVAQLNALLNRLNNETLLVSYCSRNHLLNASYCLFYDGCLIHNQFLQALYWFSRYVIHDVQRCNDQGLINLT